MSPYTEEKPCNICGSRSHRTVYAFPPNYYSHERFETASWDGRQEIALRIVQCNECGLRFSNPAFREEFLHLVYPSDIIHDPQVIRASFDLKARKANAILSEAARHVKHGATLLDVGTRYGVLPYVAHHKYGFDAHGIEYNAASVEQGKQQFSGISQGTIEQVPALIGRLGWTSVDVLVLDDVVEHLVDPKRDLSTLARTQQPGGLLLLRTMDSAGWGSRIFGRNWYYYAPAAHMYYFDERSLGRLLESVGYTPVEVKRARPLRNVFDTLRKYAKNELRRRLTRNLGPAQPARRPSHLSTRMHLNDDLFMMIARRI
jgi:2-polyprenyl-3-methyl-5-hydroxy-6-metoxy-1,4-benzoquinol methylase